MIQRLIGGALIAAAAAWLFGLMWRDETGRRFIVEILAPVAGMGTLFVVGLALVYRPRPGEVVPKARLCHPSARQLHRGAATVGWLCPGCRSSP